MLADPRIHQLMDLRVRIVSQAIGELVGDESALAMGFQQIAGIAAAMDALLDEDAWDELDLRLLRDAIVELHFAGVCQILAEPILA